jgi:hypothetical protein
MISDLNANSASQPGIPTSHTAPAVPDQDRIKQLEAECVRLRSQIAELEKERDDYLHGIHTLVKKHYAERMEEEAREWEYAMAHPETWTSGDAMMAEIERYAEELNQCQER